MRYHVFRLSQKAKENLQDLIPEESIGRVSWFGAEGDVEAIIEIEERTIPAVRMRYAVLFGKEQIEFCECDPECACRYM